MKVIFGFGSTEEQQRKITFEKAREIITDIIKTRLKNNEEWNNKIRVCQI